MLKWLFELLVIFVVTNIIVGLIFEVPAYYFALKGDLTMGGWAGFTRGFYIVPAMSAVLAITIMVFSKKNGK